MASDSIHSKNFYVPKSYWDYALAPWSAGKEECIDQAGYWITFFVIGILTLFIPQLIYSISRCCEDTHSELETTASWHKTEQEKTKVTLITSRVEEGSPLNYNQSISLEDLDLSNSVHESVKEEDHSSKPDTAFLGGFNPIEEEETEDAFSLYSPIHLVDEETEVYDWEFDFLDDSTFSETFPSDGRIAAVESLRADQPSFNPPHSLVSPLSQLCMRVIATQSRHIPKQMKEIPFEVVFVNNSNPLFRTDTKLSEEHIIGALSAWPATTD